MKVAIWAVFALVRICSGLTLRRPDGISDPQSTNSTDAFLPIPQNLSYAGPSKDYFVVPDTDPILKGVVAWPMPRVTFARIVVEACINLFILILRRYPGDVLIIGPEQTECDPLRITLWPIDARVATITYSEGIAVSAALNEFIADFDSYGNLYIYVFRGAINIATINMENVIAPSIGGNITTSSKLTGDTGLSPSSTASYNMSNSSDYFIVPNTNPQLKGVVAWPRPRFVLDRDSVTTCVRALAARMKGMPIDDIVPGPQSEFHGPLSLTLNPLHNIGEVTWMTYWEAAIVLTFFNQYMAHEASYGNFYVYIFRDSDCIGTINLILHPLSSNTTSDNDQVSVT